jgi:hypothetical protein
LVVYPGDSLLLNKREDSCLLKQLLLIHPFCI